LKGKTGNSKGEKEIWEAGREIFRMEYLNMSDYFQWPTSKIMWKKERKKIISIIF
jgi:hypothetical protein